MIQYVYIHTYKYVTGYKHASILHVHVCMCLYIFIERKRETNRERERESGLDNHQTITNMIPEVHDTMARLGR